jgi:hypothetical protein
VLYTLVGGSALAAGFGAGAGLLQLPLQWLSLTPFTSYAVPGLLLATIVGGSCVGAMVALLWARGDSGAFVVVLSAFLVVAWMLVEVEAIGFATWLEAVYAVLTAMLGILSFTYLLMQGLDAAPVDEDARSLGHPRR